MKTVVIADNQQWRSQAEPHQAVAAGLRRLGHEVEVVAPGPGLEKPWSHRPRAVFVWNAINRPWQAVARAARDDGAAVFVMERGFFDRLQHTQIDHAGFNHAASWAPRFREPAPADGADRFRRAWGDAPAPVRVREGYLLVLLQTANDAQLRDNEVQDMAVLASAVEAAAPEDMDVRLRAHPQSLWRRNGRRAVMIDGTLKEALRGAAFCLTVNSNAGNEALAMGCPVLCVGPALYAMAGVAMLTHLVNLAGRIAWMRDCRFDEAAVKNYLYHLACRQWTGEELAEGTALKGLLDAADAG